MHKNDSMLEMHWAVMFHDVLIKKLCKTRIIDSSMYIKRKLNVNISFDYF